jgi:hypothetical protein
MGRLQLREGLRRSLVLGVAVSLLGVMAPGVAHAAPPSLRPVGSVQAMSMTANPAHPASGGVASPQRLRLHAGSQPRSQAPARRIDAPANAGSQAVALAGPANGPFVFEDKLGASSFDQVFCCTPPDSTGAIGPLEYIEAVNQLVTVYGRDLSLYSQMNMGTFTGASFGLVSDPQIEWDSQAGRWLYAATLVSLHNNVLLFGWSKTADPVDLSGGWCRFGVGIGTNLADYPKLGHSDGFIVIGDNTFDDTTGIFMPVTADIWAIPKPPAGPSSCVAPTAFHFATGAIPLRNADGSLADTPVPANTTDALSFGYVVAAHTPVGTGPQSKLMLWHIAAGPTLVPDGDLAVATYDLPTPAAQPVGNPTIDTLDGRLTQAVAHFDPDAGAEAIWTQHTVAGSSAASVVRWYELLPGTKTIRQAGQVSYAGEWVFNAAISPSAAGNDAAIGFNLSGTGNAPAVGALSRRSVTPLSTMDGGLSFLAFSTQPDSDLSCTPTCRWGDYSGMTPDPLFPHAVWGSNQVFAIQLLSLPDWATANFVLYVSP